MWNYAIKNLSGTKNKTVAWILYRKSNFCDDWLKQNWLLYCGFNNSPNLDTNCRRLILNYTFKFIDFLFVVRFWCYFSHRDPNFNLHMQITRYYRRRIRKKISFIKFAFFMLLTRFCIKGAAKPSITFFANLTVN